MRDWIIFTLDQINIPHQQILFHISGITPVKNNFHVWNVLSTQARKQVLSGMSAPTAELSLSNVLSAHTKLPEKNTCLFISELTLEINPLHVLMLNALSERVLKQA